MGSAIASGLRGCAGIGAGVILSSAAGKDLKRTWVAWGEDCHCDRGQGDRRRGMLREVVVGRRSERWEGLALVCKVKLPKVRAREDD